MDYVTVYDQQGKMQAVLENADRVGYRLKHNDLWTAQFSLPTADPKNSWCQPGNWIRIPDGTRDTGLYRVVGMPSAEETAQGGIRTYQLEHVMATLLDDVLFGYHEVGGSGMNTAAVINYILARQTTARWQLGTCAFSDQYQYSFENCTLLAALMSLGEVLTSDYTWEFDVSTTPWTVSLKTADSGAGCGIHYGRNLVGIEKSMDASALITRLYPLGYGEGVNQLTIKPRNNNVPYIDADTVGTWGVRCNVWTDTRITDAATLKARAQRVLNGYKNPYITYKARAIDLYRLTGQAWDNYMPGKLVRVMDSEHDISFDARVVEIAKADVFGDPGNVEIVIANAPRDTADAVNTLADKVGIGELYSQGATNLFAQTYADNADASHPATFRVYMPKGLVRINQLLLSWQLSKFRAYETGAASGGGQTKTSTGGGGVEKTSSNGGGTMTTPGYSTTQTIQSVPYTLSIIIPSQAIENRSHTHKVELDDHTHKVTLDNHTHDIVYGIYEGSQASSVTVKVDGTTVPASVFSGGEGDVVAYMSKDADGKVTRGAWHTVQLVPNGLTRIEATLYAQCFVQSVGGGDY